MEIAARCVEMVFSMQGEEGDDMGEVVVMFNYLVINPDQTEDDCPAVRRNIMR